MTARQFMLYLNGKLIVDLFAGGGGAARPAGAPHALYNANDFPADYIIDRGHDGRRFSKSAQVRMVGNSVDPVDAADFLEANAPWLSVRNAA